MADIEVRCESCGASIKISEYADLSVVQCRKCRNSLKTESQVVPKAAIRVRKRAAGDRQPAPLVDRPPSETVNAAAVPAGSKPLLPKRKGANMHMVAAWAIFAVLALATGLLRYGNLLSPAQLDLFARISPFVFIFFHLLIVVKAFEDSVFNGILCLIVPFYSLYYLFMTCDSFYLRAVVAGTLVGIGQDSAAAILAFTGEIFSKINHFIQSGGTPDWENV